jgi:glycosyltransferase involved in cell wall biosynthesis
VDDASNDSTKEVTMNIKDNRINYIRHNIRKHASAARNSGIKLAKGTFIAFLDDDDEWAPQKLKKQIDLINKTKSNVGLIYCWIDYVNNDIVLNRYSPKLRGNIFDEMLDKQAIGNSSTILIKRKVIENIGFFDESLPRGNDGDYIRRICRKYDVDYVPEVLVKAHVGHGYDRISDNDLEGIINNIKSQKVKIYKFNKELKDLPIQASNIYINIAFNYGVIKNWKQCALYYITAIYKCPFNLNIYIKVIISLKMAILNLLGT